MHLTSGPKPLIYVASLLALAEAPVRLPKGRSPNQTASLVAPVAAQVLAFAGVPVPAGRAV
jgi:hypothetical protein